MPSSQNTGKQAGFGLVQAINFRIYRKDNKTQKEGVIKLGYFKTSVEAGATIEVTKSYTKRVGAKVRGGKEKPTAEETQEARERRQRS